jgi:hypothetical protein
MASHSDTNSRFLWLVHGLQKGKISETRVDPIIRKAAHSIPDQLLKEYLMDHCGIKNCGVDTKRKLVGKLKELQIASEETPSPIANVKTFNGDFDSTCKMYRGFELTPKENQAIKNFTDVQPTIHDKFQVQYSKSDDYGNTSTVVVKKLKEPQGHFVYLAIMKIRAGEDVPEEPATEEEPPNSQEKPATPTPSLKEESGEEIKLIKSVPINDQEGSEILTNFLRYIYRTKA